MDASLLSRMVKELIKDHDRVSLPGVGTFVAVDMPASFSDRGYTINPPYRKLTFTADKADDSLLALLYAKDNRVDLDIARSTVNKFLGELAAILSTEKTVTLEGLGRLRATKENTFFFIGDQDVEISPETMDLKPISIKALSSSPEPASEPVAAPAAVSAPAPVTNPEAVPAPKPVATPAPEVRATTAEAVTASEPDPVPVPELASEPEPVTDSAGQFRTEESSHRFEGESWGEWDSGYEDEKVGISGILKVLLWIIAAVAILVGLIFLAGHLFPDFMDHILYSPEDIEILRLNA